MWRVLDSSAGEAFANGVGPQLSNWCIIKPEHVQGSLIALVFLQPRVKSIICITFGNFKLDPVLSDCSHLSAVPQSVTNPISFGLQFFFPAIGRGRVLKSILSSETPPESCSQLTDVLQGQTHHSALPFTSQFLFSSKTTDLCAGKPFTQK